MQTPGDLYNSPLSSRYASLEMSRLFSEKQRALTFRRLWLSLAKAQKSLGLPISSSQISEMKTHLEQIDLSAIAFHEKKLKHDVMAHIKAFGDLCPKAGKIIHLGATSCYVTDNADLIHFKDALSHLFKKLILVLRKLADFAKSHAKTPCLGSTHFQNAQPTTIGKRASLWLQDFLIDALEWERLLSSLPFLGAKGATGTQSSFLSLFNGRSSKVEKMEQLIAKDFGFTQMLPISGQTYTRKIDIQILNALSSFAASIHKMATDLRLLAHDGEWFESFGKDQVGSSAMPYKRNPIHSERICGLARFVISLAPNGAYTAATQWLERSLDDSSNRRLVMPEAFLTVDALLNLLFHLVSHFEPQPKTSQKRLQEYLPLLAMENLMMAAVKKGEDRQAVHEQLRNSSRTLEDLKKIANQLKLEKKEIQSLFDLKQLIGRAPQQVEHFLKKEVRPFLNRYRRTDVSIPAVDL